MVINQSHSYADSEFMCAQLWPDIAAWHLVEPGYVH